MGYNYSTTESQTRFYVPPTLVGDFDNFLALDIPGAVMEFQVYHNWYDQETTESIRGEIYPDATKSRYANTDNNLNFRTSVKSDIQKGDLIKDPAGEIYLLDWDIPPQPNNKMSRALRCNTTLKFTRFSNEIYDDDGYRIKDEDRNKTIADSIPCNAYRYDGRPDFSAISHTPGIVPNALTILSVQYNEQTANIRVDDQFFWEEYEYIVVDVSHVGVKLNNKCGVLTIQAKKKAGGES